MEFNPLKFIQNNKELTEEVSLDKKPKEGQENKRAVVCLIDAGQIDPYSKKMISLIRKEGVDVNFYAPPDYNLKNNIVSGGRDTYVISGCDEKDKYSEKYQDCIGTIFFGISKENGKQISFMSHQEPSDRKANYRLIDKIQEFKSKVKEDSIDYFIFGGQKGDSRYKTIIKSVGDVIKKELGIDSVEVQTGPNQHYKLWNKPTNVYVDTQNRRVFLVRPQQKKSIFNENYQIDKIEEQSKLWEEK